MLFVAWRYWLSVLAAIGVLTATILALRRYQSRKTIAIPIAIVGFPLSGIAVLFLGMSLLVQLGGCETHGEPKYSPDRRTAARTESDDEGAVGGHTGVWLYTTHGFVTGVVFSGGWHSVEDSDLNWVDDQHLVIHYTHYRGMEEQRWCRGLGNVEVRCVQKPTAP